MLTYGEGDSMNGPSLFSRAPLPLPGSFWNHIQVCSAQFP